jgi:excisionase family DNA binding protein
VIQMTEDYLDMKEAASLLRVKPVTVQRWCLAGKIPSIQPGRKRLIAKTNLQAYLDSLSGAPTSNQGDK